MNALLEKAIRKISRLPEQDQEALASLILAEVEAEEGWNRRFAASEDQLGEIVRRARGEADTLPHDPSNRPGK